MNDPNPERTALLEILKYVEDAHEQVGKRITDAREKRGMDRTPQDLEDVCVSSALYEVLFNASHTLDLHGVKR